MTEKTIKAAMRILRRLAGTAPASGAMLALVLAAGCNNVDYGNRVAIGGEVTKGGEVISRANIIFQPVNGKDAQGAGGDVVGGKYNLPLDAGPTPGQQYKVTVLTMPEDFNNKDQGGEKNEILETTIEIPDKITGPVNIDFE